MTDVRQYPIISQETSLLANRLSEIDEKSNSKEFDKIKDNFLESLSKENKQITDLPQVLYKLIKKKNKDIFSSSKKKDALIRSIFKIIMRLKPEWLNNPYMSDSINDESLFEIIFKTRDLNYIKLAIQAGGDIKTEENGRMNRIIHMAFSMLYNTSQLKLLLENGAVTSKEKWFEYVEDRVKYYEKSKDPFSEYEKKIYYEEFPLIIQRINNMEKQRSQIWSKVGTRCLTDIKLMYCE